VTATLVQLRIREKIWERAKDRLAELPSESILALPRSPFFFDVRAFAEVLLQEIPNSGLNAREVAMEIHRMRRVLRDRRIS
jgi:hypothetical protein